MPKGASWLERVAQSVEHLTFNQRVMGSNPIALTKIFQGVSTLVAEVIWPQSCSNCPALRQPRP